MSWTISPRQAFSSLLDTYPGAVAAYSLRDLTGIYNGNTPVVRVRRSSDNAEQDFTATQVNNGTLSSFCGASSGFVQTWYDQSANKFNLQQSNQSSQPQIVLNGNVNQLSGRPTIIFDGINDSLSQPANGNWQSVFCVAQYTKNPSVFANYDGLVTGAGTTGTAGGIGLIGNQGTQGLWDERWYSSIFYNNVIYSGGAAFFAALTSKILLVGISPTQVAGVTGLMIGADRGSTQRFWGGKISEVILFGSNQSSNREGISSNVNAHYAIY